MNDKNILNVEKIVNDTYEHFHKNNQEMDFKFTAPMLTMVRGNLYANYVDDYLNIFNEYKDLSKEQINAMRNEFIDRIDKDPYTSEIPRFYRKRCKEELGDFDPMDLKANLKKLGLL